MFHSISERLIDYAVKNNYLDKEQRDEYIYGVEISLSVLSSYISILIIGLLTGMIWQAAVFLVLYVAVRRFAGGFHFQSQIVCYLSTCLMSFLLLMIIKYSGNDFIQYSIIMAVSTVLLLILSPVPAVEKPIDDKERVVYGIISRIIISAAAVIYCILCFLQNIYTAKIIAVTICAVAVLSIFGKIKYELHNRKKAA